MKATTVLLALALASLVPIAHAEIRPQGNPYDSRVRYVSYNADDVVTIIGHFGYSTAIEFAPDEEVAGVALGDSLAWEVAPHGNHVFVKPRETNPTTNMTVVTNKHTYQFWLDASGSHSRSGEMYFAVKFRYPEEEQKVAQAEADRVRANTALKAAPARRNWDYWACGDENLRPVEAFDDGRFTYLRYPNAQEVPAAYYEDSDGQERMASGSMRGDQLVLQVVSEKLILRRGKSVACLENRGLNPYGVATPSGTVSPSVERVIKPLENQPPVLPAQPEVKEVAPQGGNAPMPMPILPAVGEEGDTP